MSDNSAFGMIFVIAVGLVFAGVGGYMWTQQTEAINTHKPTEATVVSSSVGVNEGGADADDGPTYFPDITYRYTVDGETHRASNVMPGPGRTSRGDRGWAAGIVENHPEGSTTTVYYDPENPSEAFLIKDRSLWPLAFGGIGGLVALAGVYGLVKRIFEFVT